MKELKFEKKKLKHLTQFTGKYMDITEESGRKENIMGWYHSHPGYGCWLSKIDIDTQAANQKYSEPSLAIVVDPVRTVSQGVLNIGAFRVWPDGYKAPESSLEHISVPKDKIEDFGVHFNLYYSLEVELFKSTSDTHLLNLLWNKYWMNTLSSSPLIVNQNYFHSEIKGIYEKLDLVKQETSKSSGAYSGFGGESKKKEKSELSKLTDDTVKLGNEVLHGVMNQVLKDSLFNVDLSK
jgi:COP9 signalosome complex subunit 5